MEAGNWQDTSNKVRQHSGASVLSEKPIARFWSMVNLTESGLDWEGGGGMRERRKTALPVV